MAADVAHCCCNLPLGLSDEDLDLGIDSNNQQPSPIDSPMAGFISFTRLCKIAAEVHRFHSSLRIKNQGHTEASLSEALPTVKLFIQRLNNWLKELPDEIRFSANDLRSGPNLTMSVVVFILHSATLMNLYQFVAQNVIY